MHYLWCSRTWGITYSKDEKAEPNTTQIYANAIHPLDPNKEQGFGFADEEIYSWTCCHDEQRTCELELDFDENSSTKHG
jgi:hypothetical protein